MLDGQVDIRARDRVIDVTTECVAAAQVVFVGFSVRSRLLDQAIFFIRGQLQPQSFTYLLRDRVLHTDDVGRVRIDAIAPEQVSRGDVDQLGRHANTVAAAQKTRGENGGNTHVATGLARIDLHTLVLHDFRRWTDDERAHAREFSNHGIGK